MSNIELFDFHTSADHWRYTNANQDISYGGNTYAAKPIKRTRWKGNLDDAMISIEAPASLPPFDLYIGTNPSEAVSLTVMSTAGVVQFAGVLQKPGFMLGRVAEVRVEATAVGSILNSKLPRYSFQPTCQHEWGEGEVGKAGCHVVKNHFRISVPAAEATISGRSFSHANIGGEDDGYWSGGYVENGGQRCYILSHSGNDLNLMTPFINPSDSTYYIYPGCPHTREACENKFENLDDYLGFVYMTRKDPVTEGL